MRKFEDDEQEAASIIAWVERRLAFSNSIDMVNMYMKTFKREWIESFGTMDNVPSDFKERIELKRREIKGKLK
jgi:hypothetical protein